ncbi:MAG: histidine phosphatase family protein [Eubacterium sp.]|nr:histidine phosphatase family protein [Eubacterium sp.]
MQIYIIRHGETDWNVKRLLQGRSDARLNENGIRLTEITAEAMRDIPFTICYSSPSVRALDTARIILGNRNVPIIKEPALYEMDFGALEGKSLHPDHPEIERPACLKMHEDPFVYTPPEGGESLQEVVARCGSFLSGLAEDREKEKDIILLSTHGLASRALLYNVPGQDDDFWHGLVPPNCAVTILETKGKSLRLIERDKIYYPKSFLQDYYAELKSGRTS